MKKEILAIPGEFTIDCSDYSEDGKVSVFVDDASKTHHLICELPQITLIESSFPKEKGELLLGQIRDLEQIILSAAGQRQEKQKLLFRVLGYNVYMPLETEEPNPVVCVYVTKGTRWQSGTKIWVTSAHIAYSAENEALIPKKTLEIIKGTIDYKAEGIISQWKAQYGQVYYLI